MAGGMSNKISNVLGVPIPIPLAQQLKIRSEKNVGGNRENNFERDNDNLVYLANKTSWVRLVSSVQVIGEDQDYFNTTFPNLTLQEPDDLSKKFVLFGGSADYTSPDQLANSPGKYDLRFGIRNFNMSAYSPLGQGEISRYGFRPMPGITDVSIETQGRLGSIRMATINFKVWDKYQLDVMDALYFKLGYTMFLEWGHSVYYNNNSKLQRSEYAQIDPFEKGIKKEKILRLIAQNVNKSNGNYDAMLGMCTNFNFSFNQEGGFDCTMKIIALGALADSTKLNQTQALPALNQKVIKMLVDTLKAIDQARIDAAAAEERKKKEAANAEQAKKDAVAPPKQNQSIKEFVQSKNSKYVNDFDKGLLLPYNIADKKNATFVLAQDPWSIYPLNLGLGLFSEKDRNIALYQSAKLDTNVIVDMMKSISKQGDQKSFGYGPVWNKGIVWEYNEYSNDTVNILHYLNGKNGVKYPFKIDFDWKNSDVSSEAAEKYRKANGDTDKHSGYFYYIMDKFVKVFSIPNTTINKPDWDDITINFYNSQYAVTLDYLDDKGTIKYDVPVTQEKTGYYITITLKLGVDNRSPVQEEYIDSRGNTSKRDKPNPDPNADSPTFRGTTSIPIRITLYANSSIIKDLVLTEKAARDPFKDYSDRIAKQNTPPPAPPPPEEPITVSTVGEEEAQKFHSGLEYFVRSIQLYGLTDFLDKGKGNLLRVKEIDLYKGGGPDSFMVQAFSNGVLSSIVDNLGKDKSKYKDINKDQNRQKLMYAYASYGFNHNLMGTSDDTLQVPQVDFNALFKAWAVPYKLNEGVVNHTDINYPIYIKLGLLLMIINHMCTIYDSPSGETVSTKEQVPLLYIDFNPETNICLSEPLQMSMDPFKFLIPFRGTNEEYISLFDDSVITKIGGKAYVGPGTDDDAGEELFKPQPEDVLSAQLPEFKDPNGDGAAAYRGYIMNALVNTDYILNLCRNFASNNESQAVYLKPFLQQLITDLNKSLGDINLFRIAYSDIGNCLHIVDDQFCPQHPDEKTYLRAEIGTPQGANYTLPLFGYNSIAKSISINTEVSSRLANMIAISSNSNQTSDAGKDGSPFGHMNVNFLDRYKTQTLTTGASSGKLQKQYDKLKNEGKTEDEIVKIMGKPNVELVKAEQLKKRDINQAAKSSAKMFNAYVRSCFSTNSPSADDVSSATNYYIERMNKRKSENSGTRSSAMIPVSVEFKTDGLSGLAMGHSFVLPEELLPNTYSNAFSRGKEKKENKRIGFVVIGLNNTLQGNIWETTVKANMIYLKDEGDFVGGGFNRQPLVGGDFIGTPESIQTDSSPEYIGTLPSSGQNGNLTDLKSIGIGNHKLAPDAADAFIKMASAARAQGITVALTDSYRPFEVQDRIFDWDLYVQTGGNRSDTPQSRNRNAKRKKIKTNGKVAAAFPGTSNHGWGKSIDVDGEEFKKFIRNHGVEYGWSWYEGRQVSEDWHFTYDPSKKDIWPI